MRKTVFLFLTLWIFKVQAQTPILVKVFDNPMRSAASLSDINVLNNKFMFTFGNAEIWVSDGTESGTKRIFTNFRTSGLDPLPYIILNQKIIFFTSGQSSNQVWQTDLTDSGTTLISEFSFNEFGAIRGLIYLNGSLYFINSTFPAKLYKLSLPTIPVELLTFTAKPTNNKVQLDWKTAAELNTLGYDVERSTDGQTWSKLGFVGAKNLPSEYQYFDQTPKLNEVNYYRLCTVDIDGKKEFSKIVSVKMNEVRSPIKIYPSVTEGVIQIETTLSIQQVWVSNASGQIVLTSTQSSLNLGAFPMGVYVVTVKGGDSIFSETVFKQ